MSRRFDERFYLAKNSDVERAIADKEIASAFAHFQNFGRHEARAHRYFSMFERVVPAGDYFSGATLAFDLPPVRMSGFLMIARLTPSAGKISLSHEVTVPFGANGWDETAVTWQPIKASENATLIPRSKQTAAACRPLRGRGG
jgi:hypothetical protein